MDDAAEAVASPTPPIHPAVPTRTKKGAHKLPTPSTEPSERTPVPERRDPCLPRRCQPAAYVDVFVDDFVALAQQYNNSRR
eukprot:scaffold14376_cov92-Skeletonema_marinoi.AAC.1